MGARSRNGYSPKSSRVRQFKYERFGRDFDPCSYRMIGPHEVAHFIPGRQTGAEEIEATSVVLFDRGTLWQEGMKFAVVAEYNPAFCPHSCQPFVVSCLL